MPLGRDSPRRLAGVDQATLDGCTAKADRAEVQAQAFTDIWRIFRESNPYPSWVEVEEQTGWHHVWFDFSTPAPPSIPVIVGEFAHDLRSALDHLMWREAVERIGFARADALGNAIKFPIAKRSADFKSAQSLQYVSDDARAIMERHQPYRRKNSNALRLLHWFNREDKHRTVQVASVSLLPQLGMPPDFLERNPFAPILDWNMIGPIPYRRLKVKTKVVSLRFDPAGPDPQVRVNGTPYLDIAFRNIPRPLRGIQFEQTIQAVRAVIANFADLLPSGPDYSSPGDGPRLFANPFVNPS
jgi:hypothetical protein